MTRTKFNSRRGQEEGILQTITKGQSSKTTSFSSSYCHSPTNKEISEDHQVIDRFQRTVREIIYGMRDTFW